MANNPYNTALGTFEQELTNSTGLLKSERLAQVAAEKRTNLNGGTPTSEADFLQLYPNATLEELANFRAMQSYMAKADAIQREQIAMQQGRSFGDYIGSVAKGGVALSEGVYGLANLASQMNLFNQAYNTYQRVKDGDNRNITPSLDTLMGDYAPDFEGLRGAIDDATMSDRQRIINDRVNQDQQEYAQQVDAETAEAVKNGENEFLAGVKGMGKKFANTLGNYADNPSLIVQGAVEQIPQLMTGGAIGKLAIANTGKALAKKASKDLKAAPEEVVKRFLGTKAGQKVQENVAEKAGVGFATVSEAMSAGVEAQRTVDAMTPEELAKESPIFNELIAQGYTSEAAKEVVKQSAFQISAGLAGLLAGTASKFSGAGKLEGSLFTKGGKLNTVFDKIKDKQPLGAAKEFLEEAVQEGGNQLSQNIAVKVTANENQTLSEGVGEAAAAGAAIGGGMGAGITVGKSAVPAVKATVKGTSDVLKATARGTANLLKSDPEAKLEKEALKTNDFSIYADPEREGYSPEKVLDTLTRSEVVPKGQRDESAEDFNTRKAEYRDLGEMQLENWEYDLADKYDAIVERVRNGEDETSPAIQQAIAEYSTENKRFLAKKEAFNQVAENLTKENYHRVVRDLRKGIKVANTEESTVLGSMSRKGMEISANEAQEMIDKGGLSKVGEAAVKSYHAIKSFAENVTNKYGKGMSDVANDVLFGNKEEGNLGLMDYREMVTKSINRGDEKSSNKALGLLSNFVESHKAKIKAFENAHADFKATGVEQYVTVNGKEYFINSKSDDLLKVVQEEATALDKGLRYMQEAYTAKYNKPYTSQVTTTNTQPKNVSGLSVSRGAFDKETGKKVGDEIEVVKPFSLNESQAPTEGGATTDNVNEGVTPANDKILAMESMSDNQVTINYINSLAQRSKATGANNQVKLTETAINRLQSAREMARAIQAKVQEGMTEEDAISEAAEANPELYASYEKIQQGALQDRDKQVAQRKTELQREAEEKALAEEAANAVDDSADVADTNEDQTTAFEENTDAELVAAIRAENERIANEQAQEEGQLDFDRERAAMEADGTFSTNRLFLFGKRLGNRIKRYFSVRERTPENIKPIHQFDDLMNQLDYLTLEEVDLDRELPLGEFIFAANEYTDLGDADFYAAMEDKNILNLVKLARTVLRNQGLAGISPQVKKHIETLVNTVAARLENGDAFDRVFTDEILKKRKSKQIFKQLIAQLQDEYGTRVNSNKELLESFKHFRDEFAEGLKTIVFNSPEEFAERYPASLFANEGATNLSEGLDPNMITIMAANAFMYVHTDGTDAQNRTTNEVRNFFGVDKQFPLTAKMFEAIKKYGNRIQGINGTLGKRIFSGLDLKANLDKIPLNMQARIEESLSFAGLVALSKMGVGKIEDIQVPAVGIFASNAKKNNLATARVFTVNPNSIWVKQTAPQATATGEILQSLMDLENPKELPSFEVPVTKSRNSRGNKLPSKLFKANKKYQETPNKIYKNAVAPLRQLGTNFLADLLGFKEIDEQYTDKNGEVRTRSIVQVNNREGYIGKNNAIMRAIENMFAMFDHVEKEPDGFDTAFYQQVESKSNYRSMIVNQQFNQQNEKLHRYVSVMDGWNTTVETAEQRLYFKVAIAQAFGFDIDKTFLSQSFDAANDLLNPNTERGAVIAKAVMYLSALNNGMVQTESTLAKAKEAIMEAVNINQTVPSKDGRFSKTPEPAHALNALLQMMDYHPSKPFPTSITVEIDGLTNGSALAILQLGRASHNGNLVQTKEDLTRVGFYDGEYTSQAESKRDGVKDFYERVASKMQEKFTALIRIKTKNGEFKIPFNKSKDMKTGRTKQDIMIGLASVWKGLDAAQEKLLELSRSIAKDPVMTSNYAAGIQSITNNFAAQIIEAFNTSIEENRNNPKALKELANQYNTMLGKTGKDAIQFNSQKDAMTFKMSEADIVEIRRLTRQTYGELFNLAYEDVFGNIKAKTNAVNVLGNAYAGIFLAVYDKKIAALKEANNGRITEKQYRDLLQELKEFSPQFSAIIDTHQTHVENNLFVKNSEWKISKDYNDTYAIELSEDADNVPTNKGNKVKSMSSGVTVPTFGGTGVTTTVGGIQSSDASIMSETILNLRHHLLNIYDAGIVGIDGVRDAANTLNQATYDLTKENNFARSLFANLLEARKKAKSVISEEELDKAFETTFAYYINLGFDPRTELQSALRAIKASQADIDNIFGLISHVNQYQLASHGVNISNKERKNQKPDVVDAFGKVEAINERNANQEAYDNTDIRNEINPNKLQSNAGEVQIDENAPTTRVEMADKDNVVSILQSLSSNSSDEHRSYLSSLVGTVYNKFIEPLKLFVGESTDPNIGSYNPTTKEIRINSSTNAVMQKSGLGLDEIFSHEVVHSITEKGLDSNSPVAAQIKNFYNYIVDNKLIKPEDIRMANESLDAAKERWNYIFNNATTRSNGFSVGLHEFVAYAMTNETFRAKLATIAPPKSETKIKGWLLERLVGLFNRLVDGLMGYLNKTTGKNSADYLNQLVFNLVEAEYKAKYHVNKVNVGKQAEAKLDSAVKNWVLTPIAKALQTSFFSDINKTRTGNRVIDTSMNIIQSTAGVISSALTGRLGAYKEVIVDTLERLGATQENFFVALINEFTGRQPSISKIYNMVREARRLQDQTRATIAANVSKDLNDNYKHPITSEEDIALGKMLLKADLSALADTYSPENILKLVTDENYRNQELSKLQKELTKFGKAKHYYLRMADSLANFMVTGVFTENHHIMNAYGIANMFGLPRAVKRPQNRDRAEKLIDEYVSLLAMNKMQRVNPESFKLAKAVMTREFDVSTTDNGIIYTMLSHKEYKQRSLDNAFKGQKLLMQKGYVREIYDPNSGYTVAPAADRLAMEKDGYVYAGVVTRDNKNDPNAGVKMALYTSNAANLATWQSGGFSLASMKAKGANLFKSFLQTPSDTSNSVNGATVKAIATNQRNVAKAIYDNSSIPTPHSHTMTPVLNHRGKVTDYRYLMNENTKTKFLNRDMRSTALMGAMEANYRSKVSGAEINKGFIDALVEDMQTSMQEAPNRWKLIGLNSGDDNLKQLYQMLPEEIRNYIYSKTGSHGLFVRRELVKVLFGQRAFSLPQYAKERARLIEAGQKTADRILKPIYDLLRTPTSVAIGQAWGETVTLVKDTIVIRSIDVLVNNIISNYILLWSFGVPIKDILMSGKVHKDASAYIKAESDLLSAKRQLTVEENRIQPRTDKLVEIKAKITQLEDDMVRNPTHELMLAGVYQSIVEDVDTLNDDSPFESKLEEWTKGIRSKMTPKVKDFGNNLLINKGTWAHTWLKQQTQLSDFAARFAMYNYLTKTEKMDKQEAIAKVTDTFVDYDLPTHKSIDYLNRIGGVMFTKFLIRIQKIIMNLMTEKPSRALSLMLLQNWLGDFSDIADSFLMSYNFGRLVNGDPSEVIAGGIDAHPVLGMFL